MDTSGPLLGTTGGGYAPAVQQYNPSAPPLDNQQAYNPASGQPPPYQQPVAPQGTQPALMQPTQEQLGEGMGEMPGVVAEAAPTQVSGGKDGIGMKEGCCRNPHIVTWILTLGFWFMVSSFTACTFMEEDGYCSFFTDDPTPAIVIVAIIALIYWIECCCTGTGEYLSNILQNEGVEQFVERLKREPAVIIWNVACYHWETRTRTRHVTDANGKSRTEYETYREKVYTWRASQRYAYTTCIDVSGLITGLNEYMLTKLKFHKTFGFADAATQQHYAASRQTFRMMNWRDAHQEFHEEYSINGYVKRVLAESEPGIKPGWMSTSVYWLCNIFFFSPCFRHKMTAACGNAEYTFIKQISIY